MTDADVQTESSEPGPGPAGVTTRAVREELDLARLSNDLDGVEVALARLDEGSYWTDEVTGQPIPDTVLADNPVARRSD